MSGAGIERWWVSDDCSWHSQKQIALMKHTRYTQKSQSLLIDGNDDRMDGKLLFDSHGSGAGDDPGRRPCREAKEARWKLDSEQGGRLKPRHQVDRRAGWKDGLGRGGGCEKFIEMMNGD